MRMAALICIVVVLAASLQCLAQDNGPGTTSEPKRLKDASSKGMAYGSLMLGLVLTVVIPSGLLLVIIKICGIEEVGVLKCVYTTLMFFGACALVFYSAADLPGAMTNPLLFFQVNALLARLGIVVVVAFLLAKFMLAATVVRSIIATLLYLPSFYLAAYLAFKILDAAGALDILRNGLTG
jgi:hypothetical protein